MTRAERTKLEICESNDDDIVAYLTLPDHPGRSGGVVKNTIRLHDLIGKYKGPDLFFDFDEYNVLIGIEILD